MLDLNEMRMFIQVARTRSFTGAAARLALPANTLSRRIRRLESALKTRLLQRSTRKLALTEAGQLLYERCAAAVDGLIEAAQSLADRQDGASGTVRIAAPTDFFDLFRIEWLAEFLERHPLVHLDFVLSDARADLIAERIDVAFRVGAPGPSGYLFERIATQTAQLMASPKYLHARGTPRDLGALAEHDCLVLGSGPVTWSLEGMRGVETVRVTGRVRANGARVLQRAALAGLGIALLPTLLVGADVAAGRLVAVLPHLKREGAGFNVVLPSRQQIPIAVRSFVEFALERLRTIVPEAVAAHAPAAPRRRASA